MAENTDTIDKVNESADKPKKVVDYAPEKMSEKDRAALLGMNITTEFNEISRDLDKHHSIFYQIWEMGHPRLTFEVPTAAITFDKKGRRVEFLFNPEFWKESDTYTKMFVICHECLHVILNHGLRIKDLKRNPYWARLSNIGLDIVINHMLVDKFNFDRHSVRGQEKYCWIDTVFGKDYKTIERNRAFEYYFGLLKQKTIEDLKSGKIKIVFVDGSSGDLGGDMIDVHDFLEGLDDETLRKEIEDNINKNVNDIDKKNFVDKLNETGEGSESLKQNKENNKQAGTVAGNILFKMDIYEKVKKKRKWETVIQKWSMKFIREDDGVEQWSRANRRIGDMFTNLMLPSEIDDQKSINDRIEVWFFLDVSGSCVGLKDRFFRAARSLPEDKFLVNAFSFDTQVHEADIKKGILRGGGGTAFDILESYIQKALKADPKKKYPEAVFVMTDGYGNHIHPQIPNRWYWFLSVNYRECIPKECNMHLLKDFE